MSSQHLNPISIYIKKILEDSVSEAHVTQTTFPFSLSFSLSLFVAHDAVNVQYSVCVKFSRLTGMMVNFESNNVRGE